MSGMQYVFFVIIFYSQNIINPSLSFISKISAHGVGVCQSQSEKQSKYFLSSYFSSLIIICCQHGLCFLCNFNRIGLGYMVLNATFNNISAISWRSVLLVEETGVLGENHRPGKLYHILLHRVHLAMSGILITLVVIGTDCTGSCKSNYYAITTTTAY